MSVTHEQRVGTLTCVVVGVLLTLTTQAVYRAIFVDARIEQLRTRLCAQVLSKPMTQEDSVTVLSTTLQRCFAP